eukprot:2625219-Amphidinium_carterae.1
MGVVIVIISVAIAAQHTNGSMISLSQASEEFTIGRQTAHSQTTFPAPSRNAPSPQNHLNEGVPQD